MEDTEIVFFAHIDLFLRRNGAFRGELRVGIIPWEGETRVHIREFFGPNRATLSPGRKGVAIKINQLREVIAGLQEAEKYLVKKGEL